MTHQNGNSGNDVAICRVGNIPEHGTSLHQIILTYLPATNIVYTFPFNFLFQNTTKRKELFPLKRTTFVYVLSSDW
jgi:hypothetical protein